jgi:hypothetical protein
VEKVAEEEEVEVEVASAVEDLVSRIEILHELSTVFTGTE